MAICLALAGFEKSSTLAIIGSIFGLIYLTPASNPIAPSFKYSWFFPNTIPTVSVLSKLFDIHNPAITPFKKVCSSHLVSIALTFLF